MKAILRLPSELVDVMQTDLRRPHEFAYERVGFLYCKQTALASGHLLLGARYEPILDDEYIPDSSVGARFNSIAIRTAMQRTLGGRFSALHVHLHGHIGLPRFSNTDKREMQALMPCFVNLCPERLHGALILSDDSATGRLWAVDLLEGFALQKITFVGPRMRFTGIANDRR